VTPWAALPLAAACGLVMGSYAVTAGLRTARLEGSAAGRSRCDACGQALAFAQTVPVVSYVWLRGACAHCGARIDPVHLAGEVWGALAAAAAPWTDSPLRGALVFAIGLALVASSAVDLKVMRLPDALTAAVAAGAFALAALHGRAAVFSGLLAAAASAAVLLLLRWTLARRNGEPGLGLGDVKLTAALALWLGAATPVMGVLACALGLAAAPVLRDGRGRLPFGPMIAVAGWAVGAALEGGLLPWAR
jgi:leader peptidase (prepilin peptidase)/N-methyltransferase